MNWLIDNWTFIVLFFAIIFVAYHVISGFIRLPREEQEKRISAFLLHAVTMAEKEFGSGTGRLKLSAVYRAFVAEFGWLARIYPYDRFESLVTEVLKEARIMWEQNFNVKQIVSGDTNE